MIRAAAAGLLLLAAAAPSLPAADATAASVKRFRDDWTAGADVKTPAEMDAARTALLEPVVASGSLSALEAVLDVARDRADALRRLRDLKRKFEEKDRAKEEAAADAKPPEPPRDGAGARQAADDAIREKEEREKLPGRMEREERWQPRLAEAAGTLLDALPDPDFAKAAPRLREALGLSLEGWDAWIAAAAGRSRKERTTRVLLDSAEDSLAAFRKAFAARVAPAKELDRINAEIAERVIRQLEQQRKAGNFSDTIPASLVESLQKEKLKYEPEVVRLTSAMEAADLARRAARSALGLQLRDAPEAAREPILALLEKACLASRDPEARIFALGALGPCPGDRAMRHLREGAKDPSPETVVAALEAIARRSEAEAVEILGASLGDARWQVRAAAAAGLGATGRAAGVPALLDALAKAEGRTVDDLHLALKAITGKEFPPVAAAWREWWTRAGPTFRGPGDPKPEPGSTAGAPEPAPGDPGAPKEGGGSRTSFYGIETRSQRILFVLDFSGSMTFPGSATDAKRRKIDILLEEIRRTITGMPDGGKFNLIGFSSDVRVWKKGAVVRDAKSAKEALEWVDKQKVIGSTNIHDALETGFRMIGLGANDKAYEPVYDTIFFMTDGVPTSGRVTDKATILNEVRRWNEGRRIRVHVIGMGGKQKGAAPGPGGADDIDREFLRKLAEQNEGECVLR